MGNFLFEAKIIDYLLILYKIYYKIIGTPPIYSFKFEILMFGIESINLVIGVDALFQI